MTSGMILERVAGVRVLDCSGIDMVLRDADDVIDVIGQALRDAARLVVLPVGRLDPEFFVLRTGIAGAIVGKFASYRLRLAILGDISSHTERSPTFRAFVSEANRGRELWFLAERADLLGRLEREQTQAEHR